MVVRDRRLHGGVPARHGLVIQNMDASTPMRILFNHVAHASQGGKIHTLFVLCHGYAGIDRRLRVSMDAGGMGLQLGKEGVTQQNVNAWTAIKNRVSNIVVYACAAADTQPGNEYTAADGRYLMGALALCTNADVYAADKIQWYHMYHGLRRGAFNFATWEGQLLRFSHDTGAGTPVPSVPVELTDVLNGLPS